MADDQWQRVARPAPHDLEIQIAELRAELVALRAELATELRTRRLVVVDDAGQVRITTRIDVDSTALRLSSAPLPDLGTAADLDRHATVELWAARGDDATSGDVTAEAQVTCSTGESYAALAQRQMIAENGCGVVETGDVEVEQQRWLWGPDGELHMVTHSAGAVTAPQGATG